MTYNNGSAYTFTWQNGRELASTVLNGVISSYEYNADGLRTQKTVGTTVYDYYWSGTQLTMMTITEGETVKTLKFYYDANGTPVILDYNGTTYYYVANLQGDVMGLANSYGIVAYYEYDAWGKIIATNSASSTDYNAITANPLRYRGYIYDDETGFYYLQSRYYDPEICRFINVDGYVSTGTGLIGYNMYSYCNNNPIINVDPTGKDYGTLVQSWSIGMSWLPLIDGPLPIGDGVYLGVIVILIASKIGYEAGLYIGSIAFHDYIEFESKIDSDEDSNNTSSSNPNRTKLPTTAEPNSDRELYDEEGLKQVRHYGPDRKAEYDIDYRHQNSDGTHKFPHKHKWDWSKDPPRSKGFDID